MNKITLDILKDIGNIDYKDDGVIDLYGEYYPSIIASEGKLKGKWYWEITILDIDNNTNGGIGICNEKVSDNGRVWLGRTDNEILYRVHENDIFYSRKIYESNTHEKMMESGDVLGFYLDLDNNVVNISLNGVMSKKPFEIPFDYEYIKPVFGKMAKSTLLKLNTKPNLGVQPFKYFSQISKDEGYLPYDVDNAHFENMNYDLNQYMFEKDGKLYQLFKDEIKPTEFNKDTITQSQFEKHGTKNMNLVLKHFDENYNIVCMSDRFRERKQKVYIQGKKDLISTTNNYTKILVYADKENTEQKVKIKGLKDLRTLGCDKSDILVSADTEREDIPLALPYGYTSPQLVVPTGDIRLDKVDKVIELQLKANDIKEKVKIIYSTDSGETWKVKCNDDVWENIEVDINKIEDIREMGMTIDFFNTINDRWTEDVLKNGKIRFAYLLEIDDIKDISEVDQLNIKMSMYGMWEVVNNGKDYRYEYTNEEMIIRMFQDGTYKINYYK